MGCRSNQAESSRIEADLLRGGHDLVDNAADADIFVLNSCTVTSKADAQCRQMIAKGLKAGKRVIVTGCSAQMNKDKLQRAFPSIELFDNESKPQIINRIGTVSPKPADSVLLISRHRPIVKVQDGCDNFCSYCIVPHARGRSRSREVQDVVNEVIALKESGFNEIVLSGIHLGMYGKDFTDPMSLAALLREILQRTRMPRIRLSSLEVNELNAELLEVLSEERICNHLHLPLQSGSDAILRAMNRTYAAAEYEAALLMLKEKNPALCLGADVIVGFPGESDALFAETERLVERLPLSYLHVFSYSRREGTPAATMRGQISESIKKARSRKLRDAGAQKRQSFIQSQIGKTESALVEAADSRECQATTGNYIKVVIPSKKQINKGSLVTVQLVEGFDNFARAHEVNGE